MRKLLYRVKETSLFKIAVVSIIILSALLVGTSTYDLNPEAQQALIYMDYFVTIFFCIEIVIRFLAEESKKAFFKQGWNIFDTLIVLFSLLPAGESVLLLSLIHI